MPSVEYGRFGLQPAAITHRKHLPSEPKKRKPRQEICAPLKWLCFTVNILTFLVGVTCLALGVYLCVKDPRPISEWADVFLNPAVMLTVIGLAICVVTMMGSLGALRDNVALLKAFALSVFFCYIIIVIFTFLLFILFYSDTTEGLSAHSILIYGVKNYHRNRNLADFIDYIQEQLECCGVSSTSQGYRDWQLSYQYNCSATNPYPEKCGVPFSCCKRSVVSEAAAGSTNPLLPVMRSLECWQNAQTKRPQELEADLHTRGCLQPLRILFESHAVHVGAVVALIIVPVCISVCLSNILAKQIDHQHYLLEREARRCERRRRRERNRFRDPFSPSNDVEHCKATPMPQTHINNDPERHKDVEKGLESSKKSDSRPAMADLIQQSGQSVHKEQNTNEPRKHHKHRRVPQGSSARNSSQPPRQPPSQQRMPNDVEPKRGKRRKRSITAPSTAESRTQQWVLQQSDLSGYEPIA